MSIFEKYYGNKISKATLGKLFPNFADSRVRLVALQEVDDNGDQLFNVTLDESISPAISSIGELTDLNVRILGASTPAVNLEIIPPPGAGKRLEIHYSRLSFYNAGTLTGFTWFDNGAGGTKYGDFPLTKGEANLVFDNSIEPLLLNENEGYYLNFEATIAGTLATFFRYRVIDIV